MESSLDVVDATEVLMQVEQVSGFSSNFALLGGLMCCIGLALLMFVSSQRRSKRAAYQTIGPRFALV
jgi:hypothetical protein